MIAAVRPLSYRADLHPRLIASVKAAPQGSMLECRIAPKRWALVALAVFFAFLTTVAFVLFAMAAAPNLYPRAHDPKAGALVFTFAIAVLIGHTALLLWSARHDRAILTEFARQVAES